jgi:ABC-type branched-subunit amino acid transport system ATPase component
LSANKATLILELRHITFSFSGGIPLLDDVSLKLDKSRIYTLMGGNGAGKTTLYNIITGFFRPKSGEIYLNGIRVDQQPPFKINRQGIGRTFQDLRLVTKLSVKENIILAMKNNPTDKWLSSLLPGVIHQKVTKQQQKEADDIIQQFFLTDVTNSLASDISYGQQKLLSLACCVANGATLLLLDEPVAGIQPEYRNKIAILIKEMKEQGKTILLIEHNTDFIADVADQIFFLSGGKISTFDTIEALRQDEQVMEAYL